MEILVFVNFGFGSAGFGLCLVKLMTFFFFDLSPLGFLVIKGFNETNMMFL